jgi:hypothetical protein
MQASEATIAKILEAEMLTSGRPASRFEACHAARLGGSTQDRRSSSRRAIRISASEVERLFEESLVRARPERDGR